MYHIRIFGILKLYVNITSLIENSELKMHQHQVSLTIKVIVYLHIKTDLIIKVQQTKVSFKHLSTYENFLQFIQKFNSENVFASLVVVLLDLFGVEDPKIIFLRSEFSHRSLSTSQSTFPLPSSADTVCSGRAR
jgi:hypothetical protein